MLVDCGINAGQMLGWVFEKNEVVVSEGKG